MKLIILLSSLLLEIAAVPQFNIEPLSRGRHNITSSGARGARTDHFGYYGAMRYAPIATFTIATATAIPRVVAADQRFTRFMHQQYSIASVMSTGLFDFYQAQKSPGPKCLPIPGCETQEQYPVDQHTIGLFTTHSFCVCVRNARDNLPIIIYYATSVEYTRTTYDYDDMGNRDDELSRALLGSVLLVCSQFSNRCAVTTSECAVTFSTFSNTNDREINPFTFSDDTSSDSIKVEVKIPWDRCDLLWDIPRPTTDAALQRIFSRIALAPIWVMSSKRYDELFRSLANSIVTPGSRSYAFAPVTLRPLSGDEPKYSLDFNWSNIYSFPCPLRQVVRDPRCFQPSSELPNTQTYTIDGEPRHVDRPLEQYLTGFTVITYDAVQIPAKSIIASVGTNIAIVITAISETLFPLISQVLTETQHSIEVLVESPEFDDMLNSLASRGADLLTAFKSTVIERLRYLFVILCEIVAASHLWELLPSAVAVLYIHLRWRCNVLSIIAALTAVFVQLYLA